jgi:hypothetical protein
VSSKSASNRFVYRLFGGVGARERGSKAEGSRRSLLASADDVLLLSMNPDRGLQRKLKVLERFSEESGLPANLQKTQVVVFGGPFNSQREKHNFRYGEKQVEIVQSYRYLGVQFYCTGGR